MTSFSKRYGHARVPPPRTTLAEAPEDLRSVLRELLLEDSTEIYAYRTLCKALHLQADPEVWSEAAARSEVTRLINRLEWFEVFDLLEEHAGSGDAVKLVNESFVRTGLAYEISEGFGRGDINVYDPEGSQLELAGSEDDALDDLRGKFLPVHEQYARALKALRNRPSDDEKAISEAIGALEAVARILGGKESMSDNLKRLFAASPTWARALSASLLALYGYGSQVPGARHGRYTDPLLEHDDALFVVRACGSAIAYLVAGDRAQRWP